ncbi:zinc finger C3HC4-type RING finger family protein [Striga asiatica]|uniref:Zinc finger C3HC4-type RING finger family protein n=1 Tax=Striga asiatica TaxID=4170 RepID=A0A5A7QWH3_STRAF|nr:zinc finger C3HC4-type RING finger family protein [Striga asiatica]
MGLLHAVRGLLVQYGTPPYSLETLLQPSSEHPHLIVQPEIAPKILKITQKLIKARVGIDCSDEWWERKIKEKLEAKKFRNKAIHPSIEEEWDRLFGDTIATGSACVAPSATHESLNNKEPVNIDDDEDNEEDVNLVDGNDTYSTYSQYTSRLEGLEQEENGFWNDFVATVNGNDPSQPPIRASSTPNIVSKGTQSSKSTSMSTKTKELKRKRRQSGGSVMIKHHLDQVNEFHSNVLGLLKHGTPKDSENSNGASVQSVIDTMNDLATNGGMDEGGELWCHSICVLRDSVNREMFLKMDNDSARLSWLKFMHAKNIF